MDRDAARDSGSPFTERLVRLQQKPRLRRLARELLTSLSGLDLPHTVRVGADLRLHHRAMGTVVHSSTTIGDRVTIFHGVTIGRGDVWRAEEASDFAGVDIEDDVILCAGAVIVGGAERLVVRRGTIVAANAVLLTSTGPEEVWAGVPARRIGTRRG